MKVRSKHLIPNEIYFWHHQGPFACFGRTHVAPFHLDGVEWQTVEHYYQAAKTDDPEVKEMIREAETAAEAMRIGQVLDVRPDWEEIRDDVIRRAYYAKFKAHKKWRRILISTHGTPLHDASPRKHPYWGVKGKDRLGQILMEVRTQLKKERGY